MVRNIQMEYLQKEHGDVDLSNLRSISIDEFDTHKGQVYKTIVVDLETGRIVFVGDCNVKASLDSFWERLKEHKANIEAVCTDLSSAYTNAVTEHLPKASLVVDYFHVAKLMNEIAQTAVACRERCKQTESNQRHKVVVVAQWPRCL